MANIKTMIGAIFFFVVITPTAGYTQKDVFASFDVQPGTGQSVTIEWRTWPGNNRNHFEVERSRNNVIWEKIAEMPVQGENYYISADLYPGEGLIYYRVRQKGAGNNFLYTPVKWLQVGKGGNLYIWPNPATNVLHVKTLVDYGSINILDPGGKLLQKISITAFVTDIPTSHLSKGIYFLQVRYKNQTLTEKFVKE